MTKKTFGWMADLCFWLFKFEGYSYKARYLRKKDKKAFDKYVDDKLNMLCDAVEKKAGLTYTVEGLENIPSSGPVVYACNHQSIFDTTVTVRVSRELPGPRGCFQRHRDGQDPAEAVFPGRRAAGAARRGLYPHGL